mmetsp:Transcript_6126/g.17272  ORF Transcript_6126/g.17272 Transcript_6126/m.17272 type:complete len:310 (-) Transcript_6126:52-981(-)
MQRILLSTRPTSMSGATLSRYLRLLPAPPATPCGSWYAGTAGSVAASSLPSSSVTLMPFDSKAPRKCSRAPSGTESEYPPLWARTAKQCPSGRRSWNSAGPAAKLPIAAQQASGSPARVARVRDLGPAAPPAASRAPAPPPGLPGRTCSTRLPSVSVMLKGPALSERLGTTSVHWQLLGTMSSGQKCTRPWIRWWTLGLRAGSLTCRSASAGVAGSWASLGVLGWFGGSRRTPVGRSGLARCPPERGEPGGTSEPALSSMSRRPGGQSAAPQASPGEAGRMISAVVARMTAQMPTMMATTMTGFPRALR